MPRHQKGLTLVVSLIMLIVLTLLVVSAIRFGNINLQIAGNAQTEAEAAAATQVALEQVIAEIKTSDDISAITAKTGDQALAVSTGGKTYKVSVSKPACILTKNVLTTSLDPTKEADKPCFQCSDCGEIVIGPDGKPIGKPSACKDQQWDIEASIPVATSETSVTMLQGVAVRVGAEVSCP